MPLDQPPQKLPRGSWDTQLGLRSSAYATLPCALCQTLGTISLQRPGQGGDWPFNTPWISLKLFCLHRPDTEEHPAR